MNADFRASRPPKAVNGHKLPPHAEDAEKAALSCVLQSPPLFKAIEKRPLDFFYDIRHAEIFRAFKEMWRASHLIDVVTLHQWLKDKKLLKQCGGMEYITHLDGFAPSPSNLPYYLQILTEKHALRKLQEVARGAVNRISEKENNVSDLMLGIQAELDTVTRLGMAGADKKPALKMWKPSQLLDYNPPADLLLVGDNEIVKGYEGLVLIAGPGSSGKSLAATTLALAGAGASQIWMGRQVHRRFRTMIIQAENGAIRLKSEIEAIKQNHPELNLDEWILISSPPEGGLPFHKADFRAAVREEANRFKPDLIILDTWAQIAADDAAKDVIEKLGEIRSCFAAGDEFPGIVILAHTKKPRADEVRKGRGLVNAISGSIALANSARCVYMLLPWADEMEDPRIFWACVKLNNGKMYPASVWKRRFGELFEHDGTTNPRDFGRTDDEREKISAEQLEEAFGEDAECRSGILIKRLAKISGAAESTCWRAVGEEGYLRNLIQRCGGGRLKLKKEG